MDPVWTSGDDPGYAIKELFDLATQAGAANIEVLLAWLKATHNDDVFIALGNVGHVPIDTADDHDTVLHKLAVYWATTIAMREGLGYFPVADDAAEDAWQALMHTWEQQRYPTQPGQVLENTSWMVPQENMPKRQQHQVVNDWERWVIQCQQTDNAATEIKKLRTTAGYLQDLVSHPTEVGWKLQYPDIQAYLATVVIALGWEDSANETTALHWWPELEMLGHLLLAGQAHIPQAIPPQIPQIPQIPQTPEPPRRRQQVAGLRDTAKPTAQRAGEQKHDAGDEGPAPKRRRLAGPTHPRTAPAPAIQAQPAPDRSMAPTPAEQPRMIESWDTLQFTPLDWRILAAAVYGETVSETIEAKLRAGGFSVPPRSVLRRLAVMKKIFGQSKYTRSGHMLLILKDAVARGVLPRPEADLWPPT